MSRRGGRKRQWFWGWRSGMEVEDGLVLVKEDEGKWMA